MDTKTHFKESMEQHQVIADAHNNWHQNVTRKDSRNG
jgi:hypothetical protein